MVEKVGKTDGKATRRSPTKDDDRRWLSKAVYITCFGMIAVFGGVLILAPLFRSGADQQLQQSKDIFMAVLPILSGWVGGVLGFYFSDLAAEARGDQVLRASGGVALSERLKQVPVAEVMISLSRIEKIILSPPTASGPAGQKNPFKQMVDVVAKDGFTRTPLFFKRGDDFVFHAIAHESVIYQYDSAVRARQENPDDKSIADFLASRLFQRKAAGSTAYVSKDATLEDAKAAMQNLRGAQDVIVTTDGRADSSVVGWLTNMDILSWSVARAED